MKVPLREARRLKATNSATGSSGDKTRRRCRRAYERGRRQKWRSGRKPLGWAINWRRIVANRAAAAVRRPVARQRQSGDRTAAGADCRPASGVQPYRKTLTAMAGNLRAGNVRVIDTWKVVWTRRTIVDADW